MMSDYQLEQIKFSASIIIAFDGHFRSTWFYILTIVIGVVLSYSINNEEMSNICFLLCKTCGVQACYLFFSSKVLMEGQRWLFPCHCICYKHRSREEVDAYIGERLRMMTIRMSKRESVDTWDIPKATARTFSESMEESEKVLPAADMNASNFFEEKLKSGDTDRSETIPEMEVGGAELREALAEACYESHLMEDFDTEIDDFPKKSNDISKPSSTQDSVESVNIDIPSEMGSLETNLRHAIIG